MKRIWGIFTWHFRGMSQTPLHQPVGPARMGSDQLRQALGKGAPGTFGVSAVEPPGSQSDTHPAPEQGQVSRMPAVAAVHGTARAPAIRAATTGPDTAGDKVKQVGVVRRDCLDAAARHGTKLVHSLFYGHGCRCSQTSMLNRYNPRKARESHRFSAAWSADPGECDTAAPLTLPLWPTLENVVPGSPCTNPIMVPITRSTIPPNCGRPGGRQSMAMPCWAHPRSNAAEWNSGALSAPTDRKSVV